MSISKFFKKYDDRSNAANQLINKLINSDAQAGKHRGESESMDADGKKYPKGYTPPVDIYVNPDNINSDTKKPIEYGDSPVVGDKSVNSELIDSDGKKAKTLGDGKVKLENLIPNPDDYGDNISLASDPNLRRNLLESYDIFGDYGGKQFRHLLDYFIDNGGNPVTPRALPPSGRTSPGDSSTDQFVDDKEIYLGSFLRTFDDNEDPTMLGYDINIRYDNSPLFNGDIDSFIDTFGEFNKEIRSRKSVLLNFKKQLFRFLKTNAPISSGSPSFINSPSPSGVKVYYLKSLSGLNNLTESIDNERNKAFIDYNKDVITLGFNEDVTQNIGYLSSLYKSLWWSRVDGKQIIPDNLLKFDVDITITEIRKYNRVFKDKLNPGKLDEYADLISRYTYTLYECQFYFTDLPHGDELKMSDPSLVDLYNIKLSYKFSTMKFTKFIYNSNASDTSNESAGEYVIDNSKKALDEILPNETTLFRVRNGSNIQPIAGKSVLNQSNTSNLNSRGNQLGIPKSIPLNPPNGPSNSKKASLGITKAFNKFSGDLKNIGIGELNRQILVQAGLLNKTLNNIYNNIPVIGGIPAPKNVYEKYDQDFAYLQNSFINSLKKFVGGSVKGFFEMP